MIKFTLGSYPELIGKAGIMKTRLLNNSGNKKQASFRLAMFFLLALFTATSFAQNKYALIVAIGDYPEETDWNDISSVNDIPLIEQALIKQGFNSKNIRVLKDAEADKKSILFAFEDMTKDLDSGDVVVVHFSSHGQQIIDYNNDEIDGYDEAIVAYGAPAIYDPLYKGENHLLDEELGSALEGIRRKITKKGDLLVFVDACHSGTATRGEAKRRGGKAPFAPEGYNGKEGDSDIGMYEVNAKSRGAGDDLAPMVVVSASRAEEVNYEYNGFGSLSVAISRSMSRLQSDMSYRSFFAEILKEMSVIAPKQSPAIEGDIDRALFGGKVIEQEPYYTIYRIRNERLNLNGGELNGLFEGTEIAIFPAGTADTKGKAPIATGEIISAEGTWSNARLNKALEGNKSQYWVFVTKQTFGDIRVKLNISEVDEVMKQNVRDWAQGFEMAELVEQGGEYMLGMNMNARSAGVNYDVHLKDIATLDVIESYRGRGSFEKLEEYLIQKARGEYMKNLELEDPALDVEFEFIPVRLERGEVVDTLSIEEISNNGMMEISARNMGVFIRIINKGSETAYFNIIDIQPDGVINGILPDPDQNHNAADYKIEAGQESFVIKDRLIEFFPPYGTEVFKLFATYEPIDFGPIITQRDTRSKKTDLEILFGEAFDVKKRGGKSTTVRSDMQASTHSVTFKIVP